MADEFLHSLTDIWNSGATTFYAIKMNVTDTASAADSKLIELQVGGVSQYAVDKSGNLVLTGNVTGVNGVFSGTLTSTGAATLGGTAIPTSATLVTTTRAVATGTGLTGGGNLSADRTLALDGQALALHNLATSGLIARTGAGTVAGRTLTAGTGITVTNGNGVSGNPTAALSAGSIASLALADSAVQPARAINSGTGIGGGGNLSADRTLALEGQALALHNLGTNGVVVRTGAGTVAGRTLAVSGTGLSITNADGVAGNPNIVSNATSANTASTIVARDISGNFIAGTITAALSGNATSATSATTAAALTTARTINGTSFNGSANITTANWGTARTITIGGTGKSVSGAANVSWTLGEIGAAASSLTLTASTGLTGGGNLSTNRSFALTGQALALHNLATSGLIARTGADAVAGRTIIGGTGITATNGNGVSGNPTLAITAGGVGTTQLANSGVTSAKLATAVARGVAKAWANLNGTGTIALRDSLGVSSVVDNGVGSYGQNYAAAFANANYTVPASCGAPTLGSTVNTFAASASSTTMFCYSGSNTAEDNGNIYTGSFGNLA